MKIRKKQCAKQGQFREIVHWKSVSSETLQTEVYLQVNRADKLLIVAGRRVNNGANN